MLKAGTPTLGVQGEDALPASRDRRESLAFGSRLNMLSALFGGGMTLRGRLALRAQLGRRRGVFTAWVWDTILTDLSRQRVVVWQALVERTFAGMIKVKARGNESLDQMLRRFKKMCEKEGLTKEIKRTSYYEKPSERRRRRLRKSQKRELRPGVPVPSRSR
jgi:small subunit ribosomal protein S21